MSVKVLRHEARSLQKVCVLGILLSILSSPGARAQTSSGALDTLGTLGDLISVYKWSHDLFTNYGKCRSRGFSDSLCLSARQVEERARGTAAGDLRIFPGVRPFALTSAINFSTAQSRANNQLLGLSRDGTGTFTVQLDSSGTVDLLIDVNGYFK